MKILKVRKADDDSSQVLKLVDKAGQEIDDALYRLNKCLPLLKNLNDAKSKDIVLDTIEVDIRTELRDIQKVADKISNLLRG